MMKLLLYILLVLSVVALPSCKKNTDIDPVNGSDSTNGAERPQSSAPGFGDSKARPQGTPFVYPAGIRVVGKPTNELDCLNEAVERKTMVGGGGAVHFCFSFQNTTNAVIKLEFPPKTIWVAENLAMQNGITLKWVRLVIPAQSTVLFHLNAFCINPSRSPTDFSERYESRPIVSNHPGLDELVQLLTTKKVDYADYDVLKNNTDVFTAAFVAGQLAAEDIAREGTVSAYGRKLIAALPDVK